MTSTRPDFVVYGVAKGGTTALHLYLSQHPQLFLPAKKEPHFFATSAGVTPVYHGPRDAEVVNRMFVADPDRYRAMFSAASPTQLAGEASAMYLAYPNAMLRLLEWNPNVRIILALRNPADRAFSSFMHLRRDGREPLASFPEALAAEPERVAAGWMPIWHYRGLSRYAGLLAPIRATIAPDRLHVVVLEEFLREPDACLARLCRFLGVDDTQVFKHDVRKNRSGEPRSAHLHHLHHWLRWGGKGAMKRLLPSGIRRRAKAWAISLLEEHNLHQAATDYDTMTQLCTEFAPDVAYVSEMLGRPIPLWER